MLPQPFQLPVVILSGLRGRRAFVRTLRSRRTLIILRAQIDRGQHPAAKKNAERQQPRSFNQSELPRPTQVPLCVRDNAKESNLAR